MRSPVVYAVELWSIVPCAQWFALSSTESSLKRAFGQRAMTNSSLYSTKSCQTFDVRVVFQIDPVWICHALEMATVPSNATRPPPHASKVVPVLPFTVTASWYVPLAMQHLSPVLIAFAQR